MIWPFVKKGGGAQSARILNPSTCVVTLKEKSTSFSVDWAPDASPEFIVYIRSDAHWESPVGQPITSEDIREMQSFIPSELLRCDKVEAVVEIIEIEGK